jgi:hypothetical protein
MAILEPQTAQDAPWLHGPSLKNTNMLELLLYLDYMYNTAVL